MHHPFQYLGLRRVPLAAAIACLLLLACGAAYAMAQEPCGFCGEEGEEGAPDFSVAVSDSPDPARAGDSVTYTADVRNIGNESGSGETSVTFVGDLEVISVRSSVGPCQRFEAKFYVCSTDPAPGETDRVTAIVRPGSGGTISATVDVAEENGLDRNRANNSDTESTTVAGRPSSDARCTVAGTPGNDVLRGTPGPDVICGGQGDDRIDAGDGNDVVRAGPDNDTVAAGSGNDLVVSGSGRDSVRGNRGRDVVRGNAGDDFLAGDRGDDLLAGGDGGDLLFGDTGRDLLTGQGGDDDLTAIDSIRGNDVANGGVGSDTCRADPGDLQSGCSDPRRPI